MIDVSSIFSGFSANATSRLPRYGVERQPDPIELKAKDLAPIKEEILSYDLKKISQKELGVLSRNLFEKGLINDTVFSVMALANAEFDERGK